MKVNEFSETQIFFKIREIAKESAAYCFDRLDDESLLTNPASHLQAQLEDKLTEQLTYYVNLSAKALT